MADAIPPNKRKKRLSRSASSSSQKVHKQKQQKPKQKQKTKRPVKTKWFEIIGPSREFIPTNRLPTNRVVMQRYDNLRCTESTSTNLHEYATQLFFEIKSIWEKTTLPILDQRTCVRRIEVLLKSWNNELCRMMVLGSPKEVKYRKMMDSLMSLTYTDLDLVRQELMRDKIQRNGTKDESETLPIHEREFNFLVNQMKNPQVGVIDGSVDVYYQRKVEEKRVREEKREEREIREQEEKQHRQNQGIATEEQLVVAGIEDDADDEEDKVDTVTDPDYIPPISRKGRKPKKLDKIMLELPTKDLSKELAVLCARLRLSHRAATSVYAKVILCGGGDLKDFVLSKSSMERHRIAAEKEVEQKLNLDFTKISQERSYGILHWDGKQIKFTSGDVEEHLIICFQHVGSDTQPKFIAAPHTSNGTGAAQCEAVIRYVDECGVEDQIIGHVWDTTASNTGAHNGAAKLLDSALGTAKLWLACRRHASERHVVHANEAVVGSTKSPEEKLFKLFKENFHKIDPTVVQVYRWEGDEVSPTGPYKFTTERAKDVKEWAEQCCLNGSFPREDYRELLELLCHVLGGTIRRRSTVKKDEPPRIVSFHMEQPGAFHHARFMAKAIYYIKMFMVLPQLTEKDLVTLQQAEQVNRMSLFVILQYGQYFLQTALTTAAPRIDLEFWRNTKKYSTIDPVISDSVDQSVQRQMFYLTEELVVLALCDDNTTHTEKDEIVRCMLQCDRPQQFQPKKPDFKVDKLKNKSHDTPKLSDFVGSRSWLIFDLLDVNVQWMQHTSQQWSNEPEFQRFHQITNKIICVNDVAERNVKNVTDYAEYCKDPERRDRVVKIVNQHRDMVSFRNLTKAELSNM